MSGPAVIDKLDDNQIDEYSAAFDDALADKPLEPSAEPPATPIADGTPPATIPTPPVSAPSDAPAAPPTEPTSTVSADITTLQQQIASLTNELAAVKAAPQTAEARAAAEAITAELEWLEGEFAADWPDIKKAIDIAVRSAFSKAEGSIKNVSDAVTPIVQQTQAQAFYNELKGLVPDIDTIRDGFVGWIDAQPPTLKAAYRSIVETGTAKETAALADIYKKVASISPTPPQPPAPANDRLRNLEDVGTRRTPPARSADSLDFDSAFAEALKDPSV